MKGRNQRGRMIDPVLVVKKIIELTEQINNATDAVEYNARACGDMKRMMSNVNSSVSRLKKEEMTTVLNDRTTRDALDHLEETLERSHKLVQKCQEKQNPLQRLVTAPDLSKKLQQAKEDISQKVNVLNFVLKVNDLGHNHKRPSVKKPGGLVSALLGWKRQPQQQKPPQISVTTTPAPHGHWTSESDARGSGTMARRTTSTRRSGTPSGSVRKMPGDHPTKGAHKSTATRRSRTPAGSVQQLLGDRPTDGIQNLSNVKPNKEI